MFSFDFTLLFAFMSIKRTKSIMKSYMCTGIPLVTQLCLYYATFPKSATIFSLMFQTMLSENHLNYHSHCRSSLHLVQSIKKLVIMFPKNLGNFLIVFGCVLIIKKAEPLSAELKRCFKMIYARFCDLALSL